MNKKLFIITVLLIILLFTLIFLCGFYKPSITNTRGVSLGQPYCINCYGISVVKEPKVGDTVIFYDNDGDMVIHKIADITQDGYYIIFSDFTKNEDYERLDIVKRDNIIRVSIIDKIPFLSKTTDDFIESCLSYNQIIKDYISIEDCINTYNYYGDFLK